MLDENFDAKTGIYHPSKYAFGGLTIQREGACNACNIPAFAAASPGQGGRTWGTHQRLRRQSTRPTGSRWC